ncbi:hypothetical protein BGZ54_007816 [Gamsiella multidivaricata]|nr:hypothetical protein BGZ54_007816 [Gamsiella multidivaricata]
MSSFGGSHTSVPSSMAHSSAYAPPILSPTGLVSNQNFGGSSQNFEGGNGNGGNSGNHDSNNNNSSGLESLESLAALSVLSPALPLQGEGSGRKNSLSDGQSGSGVGYFSPSFQPPQSLPVIYQSQATGSSVKGGGNNSGGGGGGGVGSGSGANNLYHSNSTSSFQSAASSSTFTPDTARRPRSRSKSLTTTTTSLSPVSFSTDKAGSSITLPSPSKKVVVPPHPRELPPRAPQLTAPRKYHGRQTRKVPIPSIDHHEISGLSALGVGVPPTRRLAHILSEQKRREKINSGFDELKTVIPDCAQNTDSKATILRKAVDRILELEDELRKYTDAYQHENNDDADNDYDHHDHPEAYGREE